MMSFVGSNMSDTLNMGFTPFVADGIYRGDANGSAWGWTPDTKDANFTTAPPPKYKDCTMFNFVLWGIIGSSCCVLGMIGNALSFTAFGKDRRTPAVTLLQCLACSDFVLLLAVFITDDIPYACDNSPHCDNFWTVWPYIRYVWLLTPMSHMCSIWFVVLIACNRYWAVCKPHNMSRFWSIQRTISYVACIVLLVIIFGIGAAQGLINGGILLFSKEGNQLARRLYAFMLLALAYLLLKDEIRVKVMLRVSRKS